MTRLVREHALLHKHTWHNLRKRTQVRAILNLSENNIFTSRRRFGFGGQYIPLDVAIAIIQWLIADGILEAMINLTMSEYSMLVIDELYFASRAQKHKLSNSNRTSEKRKQQRKQMSFKKQKNTTQ